MPAEHSKQQEDRNGKSSHEFALPSGLMMVRSPPDDTVTIAEHWVDEIFTHGDLQAIDTIVAADVACHAPGGMILRGREGVKGMIAFYHTAFTDVRCTIEDIIAAGDRVVLRTRSESTYVGGWHGISASGQRIVETGITILRVAGGIIREIWFEVSDLDVARQLGAFPPDGPRRGTP